MQDIAGDAVAQNHDFIGYQVLDDHRALKSSRVMAGVD